MTKTLFLGKSFNKIVQFTVFSLSQAITQDKAEGGTEYPCPLYRTRQRGETYVWTLQLRTKDRPDVWVRAGVCLLLQV